MQVVFLRKTDFIKPPSIPPYEGGRSFFQQHPMFPRLCDMGAGEGQQGEVTPSLPQTSYPQYNYLFQLLATSQLSLYICQAALVQNNYRSYNPELKFSYLLCLSLYDQCGILYRIYRIRYNKDFHDR